MEKVKLNDFLVADSRPIGELNIYFPYIITFKIYKNIIININNSSFNFINLFLEEYINIFIK